MMMFLILLLLLMQVNKCVSASIPGSFVGANSNTHSDTLRWQNAAITRYTNGISLKRPALSVGILRESKYPLVVANGIAYPFNFNNNNDDYEIRPQDLIRPQSKSWPLDLTAFINYILFSGKEKFKEFLNNLSKIQRNSPETWSQIIKIKDLFLEIFLVYEFFQLSPVKTAVTLLNSLPLNKALEQSFSVVNNFLIEAYGMINWKKTSIMLLKAQIYWNGVVASFSTPETWKIVILTKAMFDQVSGVWESLKKNLAIWNKYLLYDGYLNLPGLSYDNVEIVMSNDKTSETSQESLVFVLDSLSYEKFMRQLDFYIKIYLKKFKRYLKEARPYLSFFAFVGTIYRLAVSNSLTEKTIVAAVSVFRAIDVLEKVASLNKNNTINDE